jgi:hypothetical protein
VLDAGSCFLFLVILSIRFDFSYSKLWMALAYTEVLIAHSSVFWFHVSTSPYISECDMYSIMMVILAFRMNTVREIVSL